MTKQSLETAYADCERTARRHYENFPVASLLLPKRLRRPISVIYAFARHADDLADEGNASAQQRLQALDDFGGRLDAAAQGQAQPDDPLFTALADILARYRLPVILFHDLLHAFRMDVTKTRYADVEEVLHYCRYSANPVGRLLLHLQSAASPENLRDSDAICTALQLINFLQDIDQDYSENNRIYLPVDEMARRGITERDLQQRLTTPALRALIDDQIDRARCLMLSGAPLALRLGGRFGLELRMIVLGGLCVLRRLERRRDNVFTRPRLTGRDWWWMLGHSLRPCLSRRNWPPTGR